MLIRRARKEDKDTVIDLVVEAIEDMGNIFTGYEEDFMVKEKLKELFCYPKNRFSFDSCLVAEIDGQVAGSIIAYPGESMIKLNIPLIETLRERYKDNKKMFLKHSIAIQESREAFDDEYYIDSLAVLSQYRERGISKMLIEEAEKEGLSKGYSKISILADLNNDKAFNIYKKIGYKKDCELDVLGHRFHHLVKNF